jgi:dissimilatory sulfite reductase (desulfoviridin) alpha/beta subunit
LAVVHVQVQVHVADLGIGGTAARVGLDIAGFVNKFPLHVRMVVAGCVYCCIDGFVVIIVGVVVVVVVDNDRCITMMRSFCMSLRSSQSNR